MKKKNATYQGKMRNVEEKKKTFKKAVSKIMLKNGFSGLGINKVSREAGISKTLLYRYFGNFKNLVEQYSEELDFCKEHLDLASLPQLSEVAALKVMIAGQFKGLHENTELQRLMLWELFESNYNTISQLKKREAFGEKVLFNRAEKVVTDQQDFRALAAILIAATYYLATYSAVQKVDFCGINISEDKGRKRIIEAMHSILDCYSPPK